MDDDTLNAVFVLTYVVLGVSIFAAWLSFLCAWASGLGLGGDDNGGSNEGGGVAPSSVSCFAPVPAAFNASSYAWGRRRRRRVPSDGRGERGVQPLLGDDGVSAISASAAGGGGGGSSSSSSSGGSDSAGRANEDRGTCKTPAADDACRLPVASSNRDEDVCDTDLAPPLWRRLARAAVEPARAVVVFATLTLVVVSQVLIWSDSSGGGEMFTYEGVLQLFRSKGPQWHVGLWTEVLSLQSAVALLALEDGRRLRLPVFYVLTAIGVALFLPAASLGFHLVCRSAIVAVRWWKDRRAS